MIVGIVGFKGSGKSAIAETLIAQGFRREKFAGPLKDMLRAIGLTEAHIEGDLKERPCKLLGGRTPRSAMQTLGTEWGRKIVHPDLWLMLWRARATAGGDVVVDDVRFPNECEMIKSLGGTIWRVSRAGARRDGHESEQYIDELPIDQTILNSGTLAALHKRVLMVLSADSARLRRAS